jgi:hypothetical protein
MQKMNSEFLNGWKHLDEKRMNMKKKLAWVSMKGPQMGLQKGIDFC